MATWRWDAKDKQYRAEGGRTVDAAALVKLRDGLIDVRLPIADDLAGRLADGDITLNEWLAAMRQHIQDAHVAEYLLGRGGRNQMEDSDWTWLAGAILGQYQYLQAFAQQIQAGVAMTQLQVAGRSRLYFEASKVAFEAARAAAMGLPEGGQAAGPDGQTVAWVSSRLPEYPGSGRTRCLTRCRCYWVITELPDRWEASWKRTAKESCVDCVDRSRRWARLIIKKR